MIDRSLDPPVDRQELHKSLGNLMERLAKIEAFLGQAGLAHDRHGFSDGKLAELATSLYRLRQLRRRYFEPSLLADPAWDMLLDLFISTVRGSRVATTSLCLAASVPQATGLRVLASLQQHELLSRHSAPDDGRLKLVSITPKGFQLMRQYLSESIARFNIGDTC